MKVLLLILCWIPFSLPAQTFPLDPVTGEIIYAEEVLVKDGPQLDLYHRAKSWLQAFNKGKASSITADDAANGLLTGRNYTQFTVAQGRCAGTYRLWFTLHLTLADDRYWYRLDSLQLQKTPLLDSAAAKLALLKQPLEEVIFSLGKKDTDRSDTAYRQFLEKQVQAALLALIEDFKKNML